MPAPSATVVRLTGALVLALAVAGCGSQGVDGNAATETEKCRAAWEDTRQGLGENGSPAEDGSTLTKRWEALDDEVTRLATTATGTDCPGRLDDVKNKLGALNDLAVATRQYDMLVQLDHAENDLRHAIRTRDYDPLPRELAALFRTLRTQAPIAHGQMKEALDKASDAGLDAASVKAAEAAMRAASTQSPAYEECRRALAEISSYELDEE